MLKGHGRYPYSSLPSRPKYEWPNGTKVAVYVAMNIEAFSFGEGKGAAIAPPDQAHSHSVYSWRDYGNRVGFWRLMDMFVELGIPAEHQLNTAVYSACPDIPARIRARGDEILGHGTTNSLEQGGWPEADERKMIEDCTRYITEQEGGAPTGWMSPWLSNSEVTMDLLQEAGYRYVMDWTMDDQPVWLKTRGGRILSMPYPVGPMITAALFGIATPRRISPTCSSTVSTKWWRSRIRTVTRSSVRFPCTRSWSGGPIAFASYGALSSIF